MRNFDIKLFYRGSASFAVVKLGSEFKKNATLSKDMSNNLNLDLAVLKERGGVVNGS